MNAKLSKTLTVSRSTCLRRGGSGRLKYARFVWALALVLSSASAFSADWTLVPSVTARAGWSDNLFLDSDDPGNQPTGREEISTAWAQGSIGADLYARTQLDYFRLGLVLDYNGYSEDVDVEQGNQDVVFQYRRKGQRSQVRLNGFVRRDSITRAIRDPADFDEIAEEEIDLGSGDLTTDQDSVPSFDGHRIRAAARPSFEFSLNQKTSAEFRYAYNNLDYSGIPEGTFQAFSRHTLDASIGRRISPSDTVSLTVLGGRFETDDDLTETDTLGITLSYERALREDLDVYAWISGLENETTSVVSP